jgi:predicted transport protein
MTKKNIVCTQTKKQRARESMGLHNDEFQNGHYKHLSTIGTRGVTELKKSLADMLPLVV